MTEPFVGEPVRLSYPEFANARVVEKIEHVHRSSGERLQIILLLFPAEDRQRWCVAQKWFSFGRPVIGVYPIIIVMDGDLHANGTFVRNGNAD